MIISGTNFSNVRWISFGATAAASFSVNSTTQITAVTPAHDAGAVHLFVNTSAGTSTATTADLFVFGSPPTISSVSPNVGPAAGGQPVIISGTNFTDARWVSFGPTAAASFTVDSATQITAVTPAHTAGTVHIFVNNAAGTSTPTNADTYTFN